jgi:hypothetical protein
MKQENVLVLIYCINYVQDISNIKKEKNMKTTKNRLDLTVLKQELNALAETITNYKRFTIKEAQNTLRAARGPKAKERAIVHLNKVCSQCKKLSTDYRHLHIAHGELCGVPRKKMENVVTAAKLDEDVLQKIKDRFV